MMPEEEDRMLLGWTREHLARVSGVAVSSIYVLERLGSAGERDDELIRAALAEAKAMFSHRLDRP